MPDNTRDMIVSVVGRLRHLRGLHRDAADMVPMSPELKRAETASGDAFDMALRIVVGEWVRRLVAGGQTDRAVAETQSLLGVSAETSAELVAGLIELEERRHD